jgi:hypothetical protein
METIHIFDEFIDKDLNGSDPQILHQKRTKLEPFIYDILKIKYYTIFDTFWKKNTVQKDTNKSIVIIERRIHPNLSFLIRNMFYYARDWSITIICSDINFSYLKTILTNNSENVILLPLFEGSPEKDIAIEEYNTLLKSSSFYNLLSYEHLLIVQTDTYLRRKIDETIFNYDYVASYFAWDKTSCGGGMSFRKRSSMIDICDTFKKEIIMEDCFINEGVKELGYTMPDYKDGINYICESCYSENPFGLHQWWTFYSIKSDPYLVFLKNYLELEILKDE